MTDAAQPQQQQARVMGPIVVEHSVRLFEVGDKDLSKRMESYLDDMSLRNWQCAGTQISATHVLVIHIRPRMPRVAPVPAGALNALSRDAKRP